MEKGRCALLDAIGFGYLEMVKQQVIFPVADIKLKYIKSLRFGENVKVVSILEEYENCIKIKYEIYNADSGMLTTKGESTQMAVDMVTGETKFVCPSVLIERVQNYINTHCSN